MNRPEARQFLGDFFAGPGDTGTASAGAELKPFLDLVLSLKQNLPLSIPLLRELAGLITDREQKSPGEVKQETGPILGRMDRRYQRLCRIQKELGRLDLKKAAQENSPDTALEDYVFSRIDFSRYQTMNEKEFEFLVPGGLTDFSEAFFKKNFRLGRSELQSLIKRSYKKTDGVYRIQPADQWENSLILSVMRTLETSLETLPLFTAEEIQDETENLLGFVEGSAGKRSILPGMKRLYPLLVSGLDNVHITHADGMTTRLFISAGGDLSGTFQPGGKPWTVTLIKR